MTDFTQAQLDDLEHNARMLAPEGKVADLDADIKAKKNYPNLLGRFLEGFIRMIEARDLEKYAEKPAAVVGEVRKPAKTNPWSAEGWNVTAQARLTRELGEKKAGAIAEAAGCKIGSTKSNPAYN